MAQVKGITTNRNEGKKKKKDSTVVSDMVPSTKKNTVAASTQKSVGQIAKNIGTDKREAATKKTNASGSGIAKSAVTGMAGSISKNAVHRTEDAAFNAGVYDPTTAKIMEIINKNPPAGMNDDKLLEYYQAANEMYEAAATAFTGMEWGSTGNQKLVDEYERAINRLMPDDVSAQAYINWYKKQHDGALPLDWMPEGTRKTLDDYMGMLNDYSEILRDRAEMMTKYGSSLEYERALNEYKRNVDTYNEQQTAVETELPKLQKIVDFRETRDEQRKATLYAKYYKMGYDHTKANYMADQAIKKERDAYAKAYGYDDYNALLSRYHELRATRIFTEKQTYFDKAQKDPDFEKWRAKGEENNNAWKKEQEETKKNSWFLSGLVGALTPHNDQTNMDMPEQYEYENQNYGAYTQEEIDVINYWNGKESAGEVPEGTTAALVKSLEYDINARGAEKHYEEMKGNLLSEYLFTLEAGLDQFVSGTEGVVNAVLGKDEYPVPTETQMVSSKIIDELHKKGPVVGSYSVGESLYNALTTTINMIPSIGLAAAANLIVPGSGTAVGAISMGGSAGGNAYNEFLQQGYTVDQARMYGTLTATSETVMQYLLGGIAKLGGKLTGHAASKVLTAITKGIGKAEARFAIQNAGKFILEQIGEGIEEFLQDVINPFLEAASNGEAPKDIDWEAAAYSGVLGALSAGLMNGAGAPVNVAKNMSTVRNIAKTGGMEALINLGKSFDESTVAGQLAREAQNGQIGTVRGAMMLSDIYSGLGTQTETDIQNALIEKGMSEADAESNAKWIAKGLDKGRFSDYETNLINEDARISDVIYEMQGKDSSINRRYNALAEMRGQEGNAGIDLSKFKKTEIDKQKLQNTLGTSVRNANLQSTYGTGGFVDRASGTGNLTYNNGSFVNRGSLIPEANAAGADFRAAVVTRLGLDPKTYADNVSRARGKDPARIVSLGKDGSVAYGYKDKSGVNTDDKHTTFKSKESALLWKAVAKMASDVGADAETANMLANLIDRNSPYSVEQQLLGMQEAFTYGRISLDRDAVNQKKTAMYALSPAQEQAIYKLGQKFRDKSWTPLTQEQYESRRKAVERFENKLDRGEKVTDQEMRSYYKAKDDIRRFEEDNPDIKKQNKQLEKVEREIKRQEVREATSEKELAKDEAQSVHLEIGTQSGDVELLGIDSKTLTKLQRRSILVINALARTITKNRIVWYESVVSAKGERVYSTKIVTSKETYEAGELAANGIFDPGTGTIYLDINAGNNGQGAILWSAAHEFTHYLHEYNRAQFDTLGKFLVEKYAERGYSVDEYVNNKLEKLKKRHPNKDGDPAYEKRMKDLAYEEWVCDSMSILLTDTNAAEYLAELKAKDRGLWQKMKDFFVRIANRARTLYKGMTPDSDEAQLMRTFGAEDLEKFARMFSEGLVKAGENYEAAGVSINTATESASPMMSERTWSESQYVKDRNAAAAALAKALGVTKSKALKYIDDVNGVAKMIADDRTRLDYIAAEGLSSFVSNVEYGGSFDFSTLCAKRRYITGTIQAIQAAIGEGVLSPIDILKIRNMMKERKYVVNCGLCYVEGSRSNMGKFAKEFIARYKQHNPDATWIPKMQDVFTPVGIEHMRTEHPDVYAQYEKFWNNHGKIGEGDTNLFASQQKPKQYQMRTDYKNEITKLFKDPEQVKTKNRNGGIRIQSFSDFELVHAIDMMQVLMDMSRVGLAGQAYTKVPEFAWAFGATGLKINLSLIAKGVDADGKLIFDDVEGMPADEAFKIRDAFSKNVGTILVTFDDAQLKAAMADPRVDFIIPFHRSQWKKAQYADLGLPSTTKDYTYVQNEKYIVPKFHEWNGKQVKDKATNYMPNTYWDFSKTGKENAEHYLEMCAADGKRPKFYKLLDAHPDGRYTLKKDGSTDGYWKLLIDFKMYDNDGVGSPQEAVRPVFNMGETGNADMDSHSIPAMLQAYEGGHDTFPVAEDVVRDFTKEYKKNNGLKFSDRDRAAIDAGLASARAEGNQTDVDYFTALKNGDMRTAARMVAEKALGKNVFLDQNGKPLKLFHGTDSFGFTSFRTPLIFTTPDEGVAAGYANGKGYADPRRISDSYIPDDGTDKTLISNVKNVLHREAREITDADLNQVKDEFQKAATEWRDRVNEAWDYKEGFPEMPIDINNGLDYMMIIAGEIEENLDDMFTGGYPFSELEYSIERYNEEREKVRSWFGEHREEILAAGNEDLYRLVVGYDYTDFLIDVEYRLLPAFHADEYLINNNGKFASKEKLRASVEQYRSLGAYTLYGMMGSNPLEIDAKGAFWTDVDASALGGEKWSTEKIAMEAQAQGYTSLVIRNVMDPAMNNYSPNRRADEYIFFSPETVKSADTVTYDDNGNIIPLSERFNEKDSDIRFSYRGEKAKNHDQSVLARAIQMEKDGDDSETIRKETGWFRGMDNRWRYEIDDSDMEIRRYALETVSYDAQLHNFIDHPELFKAYPELYRTKLRFARLDPGTNGDFNAFTNTIRISEDLRDNINAFKKTLMHEIQHAIQNIEGFAQGTNPDAVKTILPITKEKALTKKELRRFEIKLWEKYGTYLLEEFQYAVAIKETMWDDFDKILQRVADKELPVKGSPSKKEITNDFYAYLDLVNNNSMASKKAEKYEGRSDFETYRASAGEVEARDVADRVDLSAEGRYGTRPDIDRTDVVFNHESEVLYEGQPKFSTRSEVLNHDGVDWMDNFSTIRTQLKKHKDKINNLSPVASVLYGGETKKDLEELITQQVKKIGGERFVRNGISFNFDKTGVHNLVLHAKGDDGRAAAILAPYVAKRGVLIAGHKKHENHNTTTLTYAAPVIINGNSAHVGVAIMFTTDGRAHAVNVEFLDTVSGQQKKKPASGLRSRSSSEVTDLLTNADSKIKDTTDAGKSQPKLSDRDRASMTEERIDWLIRDNGAGKRTDYARGWITSISPTDFINLTTKEFTDRNKFDRMKNDYGTTMADYDYMRELKENQRETPYLAVDMNTGEVVGHEGRHRMRALEQAGVTSVPIKIEFRDENGYVAKEMNGYGNPLTTIAEQALTNQYGNGYTASVANVMPLMQAMRDEIVAAYGQEDSAIRFSDRDQDATDPRTLLSNALMTAAQSDLERQKLEQYQAKIKAMNEEQNKLTKLRQQIRELSFGKGKRDTEKLKALREEATKTANRVTNYDRQLLRLEASAPLARVTDELTKQKATTEVAKARQQEREKAQKRYERYEADIQRRKESRQKGIDQRKSTDLRDKIKRIRTDFERALEKGNERTHIPAPLAKGIIAVCEAIDPTGEKQDSQAAQRYRSGLETLGHLKMVYDALENSPDYDLSSEFRKDFSNRIADLAAAIGDTPLRDMNREQLQDVYNILNDIRHTLQNAKRQIREGEAISNYEVGQRIIENQRAVRAKQLRGTKAGDLLRTFMTNPLRAVQEMSGFQEDAELTRLMYDIDRGLREADMFRMRATKVLDALRSTKADRKMFNAATEEAFDFGLTDVDGRPLKISKMQAMQILLTYDREQNNKNRKHLENIMFIPDVDLMRKGKYAEALEKAQEMPVLDEETINKITSQLNDWDLRFMDAARKVFYEMSSDAVNRTSMLMIGRPIATESHYIPYEIMADYLSKESENVDFNIAVANMGMVQSMTPNAKQPLVMRGLNTVLDDHIDNVAKYSGLSVPVRNWNKAINVKQRAEDGNSTVKWEIRRTWGADGESLLDKAVADVQGPRPGDKLKIIGKIKQNWVTATLAFNVSVWMKQAASFPTAGSILSTSSLLKALPNLVGDLFVNNSYRQQLWDEIDQHTATHWIRRQGLSTQELGDFNQSHGWANRLSNRLGRFSPMNWIQSMDVRTTAALWLACKNEIEKQGINENDEGYWDKVTALYDKVIEDTQPMYDPLHRAEITKNAAANFIVFQTQPIQNSGILREATYKFKDARKMYGKGSEQAKAAGVQFGKAVSSQLVSHMVFSAMTALAAALLHKMNRFRDKDKDLTPESFAIEYAKLVGETYFGAVLPIIGGYLTGILDNVLDGTDYSILSDPVIDKINNTLALLTDLKEPSVKTVLKAMTDILEYFGVPANNMKNIAHAIRDHIADIQNGEFFSFEAGVKRSVSQQKDRLKDAFMFGTLSVVDDIRAEMIENSSANDPEKSADNAIKDVIKELYQNGELTKKDVEKYLDKYFSITGNDAYWLIEKWGAPEADEDEDGEADAYHKYDEWIEAVSTGQNIDAVARDYVEHGATQFSSAISEAFKDKYTSATGTEKKAIADKIIAAYTAADKAKGMDPASAWDIKKEVLDKWDYAKANGGSEKGYSIYIDFWDAVETGTNLKAVIKDYMDNGGKKKEDMSKAITNHFKPIFQQASKTEQATLLGYLLNAYEALGYNRAKKYKDIVTDKDSWLNTDKN